MPAGFTQGALPLFFWFSVILKIITEAVCLKETKNKITKIFKPAPRENIFYLSTLARTPPQPKL